MFGIIRFRYFAMAVLFSFCGCLKGELPVLPHEPGDVRAAHVDMGSTYKYQVYYNLKENRVVGQCEKTSWDVAFENGKDGFRVFLNSSRSMFVLITDKTNINEVTKADTTGFGARKRWDGPGGELDSSAIGNWRVSDRVYIIDRGYDELGKHTGFVKLKLEQADAAAYKIRYAALDSKEADSMYVAKDDVHMFSYCSFSGGVQVYPEPPSDKWDILFTQYTHVFYGEVPITPYLVVGCLTNRKGCEAYLDTGSSFVALEYRSVDTSKFLSSVNSIGYDWKVFSGSKYTIRPHNIYVIRTGEGQYYKLRFTGFYDASGTKGRPSWEYQAL